MRNIGTAAAFVICVMVLGALTPCPVKAETAKVLVSAFAPITQGDVAGAQSKALKTALANGIEKVLAQIVPERTYEALEPLLKEKVLPRAEQFITHYQIASQDVSDLAYTVKVSVTVDADLLRKNLVRLGVIKEPGSPPLTAIFVTVEAPVGLEHVRSLGSRAQESIASELERSNLTVIPVSENQDLGFRVLRPPQAPEALVSEGIAALADLSVGIVFRKNGEAVVTGSTMTIPMSVHLQAVDVQTGVLVDAGAQETSVKLGTKDGALLSKDLGKLLSEMAVGLSANLRDRYLVGEQKRGSVDLVFEGLHEARSVRIALGELLFRLGESATVVPVRFSRERSIYTVWSDKGEREVYKALSSAGIVSGFFTITEEEGDVVLREKGERAAAGVHEFGEEVTFYRRLPVPGVENPDDIRKVEYVGWQEREDNSGPRSANAAPVGMGILGRIDPPRDQDFFFFRFPEGTDQISIHVEQVGPGEVRPRARVFRDDGRLIDDQKAKSRGKSLFFTLHLQAGITEVLLSVEDHLGRHSSMFPYVLRLGVEGKGQADEPS